MILIILEACKNRALIKMNLLICVKFKAKIQIKSYSI